MDELIDMGLPIELLTLYKPLELLGIGVDVQVKEVLESLLVCLGHASVLISKLSEIKNAIE